MNVKLFFSFILFCSVLPFMVNAAVVPVVVEGVEGYSKDECVTATANDCIHSICETSSELNCEEQCKTSAVDKCHELNE